MKLPKEMIIEMFKNAKLKKTKFVQTEEESKTKKAKETK